TVHLVERDVLLLGGAVELHRDGHQPERDGALPDASHALPRLPDQRRPTTTVTYPAPAWHTRVTCTCGTGGAGVYGCAVTWGLAVTALLAVLTLHARLQVLEWFALGLVTAGLTMLALSARDEPGSSVSFAGRLGLFIGVVVVGVASAAVARRRQGRSNDAWAL